MTQCTSASPAPQPFPNLTIIERIQHAFYGAGTLDRVKAACASAWAQG